MENKSQSSGNTGIGSGTSSGVSPSPPDIGSGRPFEDRREYSSFPTLPSNAPSAYQGLPLEPGSALPSQGDYISTKWMIDLKLNKDIGPLPHAEYGYHQEAEMRSPWQHGGFEPHPPAVSHASSPHQDQQYWRYNHGGRTADFAPFPLDSMQSLPAHNPHAFALAPTSAGPDWQLPQQPARSMSYPHPGGIMPSNSGPYTRFEVDASDQMRPTRHAPSPLEMQNSSFMGQAVGPQSAPAGQHHGTFLGHPHPYALQGDRNQAHDGYMKAHPTYPGNWYNDPTQFESVNENARGPS